MSKILHQKLADWLDPCRRVSEPVDLGELKKTLVARGVNGRGWRLYLDFGDALFAPLGKPWVHDDQPFTSGPNAIAWLRLLQACEMDVLPPPELTASIHAWLLPGGALASISPVYFRAVWKAAVATQYTGRPLEEFLREEVGLVNRWLCEAGLFLEPDPALMKAGWHKILDRAKAALTPPTAVPAPTAKQLSACEWDPYVRRIEWGGYVFVALSSAAALKEEGDAMQHCVGDYDENCRSGITRIYSVRERKSGMRVATCALECSVDDDGITWEHDQTKGIRNAEVPREVLVATDAVLRSYLDLPQERFHQPAAAARTTFEELYDEIPF